MLIIYVVHTAIDAVNEYINDFWIFFLNFKWLAIASRIYLIAFQLVLGNESYTPILRRISSSDIHSIEQSVKYELYILLPLNECCLHLSLCVRVS